MSDRKATFDPEPDLRLLEGLASRQAPSSPERASIELAAKALLFIHATQQTEAFGAYLETFHSELTDEQREHLARLGLA